MTLIAGKPASFWIDSTAKLTFSPFVNNTVVDVAIVGAGIAGLTAAMLLKRAGKTVAVIESRQVSTGVSGHTTAKITSLHQLIYANLIKEFGAEKARLYGESNQAAIEQVAKLVEEEQIDCEFSRQSAYTFSDSPEHLDKIEAEVEAAVKLGLPASFVKDTSLPFPITGAVQFENQAQFHPRKYLLHLAQTLPGNGSYLFEETRVEGVEEGSPCQITTNRGVVKAADVIVATNLPILDQGLFFAKTYPKRSYIVAAQIETSKAPEGMYIGVGENYRSIRTTPYEGGTLLLVGGEGHKTGTVDDTEQRYLRLEDYARDRFGVDTFEYRWSTQDMVSFDKLPYIGKLTPLNNHIYVATGFTLWGMSKGTLSGMLLSDLILGRENPWAELYDATRATPFVSETSLKENSNVAKHWVGDRLKGLDNSSFSEVARDEGKLVTINGNKVAAYRDEQGTVHAVSAVCPHLACIVDWNSAEKSWDCPCHGSRFTYDGELIQGPAVKDLES
ncbi:MULTISPECIES: FAD-dependent oxidoreductase [unclassified Coleofasciculus]|uniref:FAD-dependent oxidoreductase n=1 Tax=unclassified Coleofasciculus TaxID=2692782 RepID=UPI00187EC6CF|nr:MULTISPECIES: FAD-dependent oxidoreductase [unclassified Coleofasciculus]MBE9126669.1 FAD-dependent oxidoreductase [Coleofasciculus sp. LEGE 07081]MBE9148511.1 FAD-dependent oxidoreductase [Coleofasciculus sp. LEGE 07092]